MSKLTVEKFQTIEVEMKLSHQEFLLHCKLLDVMVFLFHFFHPWISYLQNGWLHSSMVELHPTVVEVPGLIPVHLSSPKVDALIFTM